MYVRLLFFIINWIFRCWMNLKLNQMLTRMKMTINQKGIAVRYKFLFFFFFLGGPSKCFMKIEHGATLLKVILRLWWINPCGILYSWLLGLSDTFVSCSLQETHQELLPTLPYTPFLFGIKQAVLNFEILNF